jgi:RimJ/RimL family protein N-acetyltransferase
MLTGKTDMQLETSRLLLRRWRETDMAPFAQMNSDDRVMEFFSSKLSYDETVRMVERIESSFDMDNLGLWALELKQTGEFIGFTGLSRPKFYAHFTPCTEVGWRISQAHWGNGYATEAAKAALRDGFERLGLSEIVSFTAAGNDRSIRVMKKLHMHSNHQDDFLHPLVTQISLKRQVLYKLSVKEWREIGAPELKSSLAVQVFQSASALPV